MSIQHRKRTPYNQPQPQPSEWVGHETAMTLARLTAIELYELSEGGIIGKRHVGRGFDRVRVEYRRSDLERVATNRGRKASHES